MAHQDIVAQARSLRAEAGQLLHDEGPLALIGGVGRAEVGGTYALDLMTGADIDVQLPPEKNIVTFFELGREIATRFQITKMSFSNQFIWPDVPINHGLRWGYQQAPPQSV